MHLQVNRVYMENRLYGFLIVDGQLDITNKKTPSLLTGIYVIGPVFQGYISEWGSGEDINLFAG